MGKQDRLSIDLKGIRPLLQNYRTDSAWKQLSLSARIRAMVIDAWNHRHGDKPLDESPPSIAQIVADHWDSMLAGLPDVSMRRLGEIKSGAKPTEDELLELGRVLPYNTLQLIEIRDRDFKNGQTNGQPTTNKV